MTPAFTLMGKTKNQMTLAENIPAGISMFRQDVLSSELSLSVVFSRPKVEGRLMGGSGPGQDVFLERKLFVFEPAGGNDSENY